MKKNIGNLLRIIFVFLVICFFLFGLFSLRNGISKGKRINTKSLIVQTKNISAISDSAEIISAEENLYLVKFDSFEDTKDAYRKLSKDDKVEKVIPNDLLTTTEDIKESEYAELKISKEIKEIKYKDDDYVIALIDTGVSDNCSNIKDNVSIIEEDANYEYSHGSKMADVITKENPEAEILSIKAMDKNGHGSVESIYKAIEYAIDANVDIINLSLSGYSNSDNDLLKSVIEKAKDKGIIVVGSAGNRGKNVEAFIPGNIDDVIVVGSSDSQGIRNSFSNYGKSVDYYLEAENTSIATAKMTGKLSRYNANVYDYQGVIAKLISDKEVFDNKEKYEKDEIIENMTVSGFNADATIDLVLGSEVEVARDVGEYTYQRLILWTTAKLTGYTIDANNVVKARIEFRQYLRSEKKLDGASVPIQWASDVKWYVDGTNVGTKIFPRPGEMVVGTSNTRQTYDGSSANWVYSNPTSLWYDKNLMQGPITFEVSSGTRNIKTADIVFGQDITSNEVNFSISVPYAVLLQYHMNGGALASAHGSDISSSGNYVTVNGSKIITTIINGNSLTGNGLPDYNNSSYINIARTGYRVADTSKIFQATVNGTTKYFNQTTNYSSSDFGGASGSNKVVDLKINWTANTYNISYTLNGGTAGTNAPTTATYDSVVTINNPTKTGYTFAGWTMTGGNASTAKYGTASGSVTTSWSTPTTTKVKAQYFKNLTPTNGGTVTLVANWTANSYTIGYTLNGGTHGSSHPTSATYDSVVTISNPTRTGYTFTGWTMTGGNGSTAKYGTASGSVTTSWSTPTTTKVKAQYFKNLTPSASGSVTFVANWTANTYTIEYYQGNNSTTVGATKIGESTHTYGTAKNLSLYSTFSSSLPSSTPNSTWTFAGWDAGSPSPSISYTDGESVIDLTSTNGGVVALYAVFERNITFYSGVNKATTSTIKQYYNPYGSKDYLTTITPPTLREISGWNALGYRTDTTANSAVLTVGTSFKPTYDATTITYYGVYSKEYTANFYSGVSKATNNPITGYAYYNTNTQAVPTTINITLKTADDSANITYWNESGWRNDTTPAAREYTYGQTNVSVTIGTSSFYSIYTRTLTVTYNGNGNTGGSTSNSTKTVYLNAYTTTTSVQSVTTRANGFTKTGHTAQSPVWNTAANGSGTAVAASATYTVDPKIAYNAASFTKTLYAQWTANTYTVTYKANGGTGADVSDTVTYGQSYTVKGYNTFSRTGYRLTSWNEAADGGGTSWTTSNTNNWTWTYTTDVILYAQWTINTSKLTVNPNGGKVSVTSPTGGTQETITTSKTYTQNYNTTLSLSEPKKNPLVVETIYTITYNPNGGDVGTLTYENTTATFTDTTNYKFTGWTKSSTFYGTLSTDNKTYTFPSNNNVTSTITANYGVDTMGSSVELIKLPTPTRPGYHFQGWYTAETGGILKGYGGDTYQPNQSETLYARWSEQTISIRILKNNEAWNSSGMKVALYDNNQEKYSYSDATVSGNTVTFHEVISGSYYIYASKSSGGTNNLVYTGYVASTGDVAVPSNGSSEVNYYTLTLNKGVGISAVSGAGTYLNNQSANIDATVSNGYTWQGWSVVSGDSPN